MRRIRHALRLRHSPLRGCRANQHQSRRRSCFPQWIEKFPHRMRSIRVLRSIFLVAISLDHRHPAPVRIQFIRQNARQARAHSIPHLRTVRHDQHRPVALNAHVHARMKRSRVDRRVRQRHVCRRPAPRGQCERRNCPHTQHKRARPEHSLEKMPPRHVLDRDRFHGIFFCRDHAVSFAACWIAARIRWYVPQRQMLPDITSSISESLG